MLSLYDVKNLVMSGWLDEKGWILFNKFLMFLKLSVTKNVPLVSEVMTARLQRQATYHGEESPHPSLMRRVSEPAQKIDHYSLPGEERGFKCCKCSAQCPPTKGQCHQISPNLLCFYVEHSEDKHSTRFWVEKDGEKTVSKLEMKSTCIPEKFLTSIYLRNIYTEGGYCQRCFQKYAPIIAKNEANNVCFYYDIKALPPIFTIENSYWPLLWSPWTASCLHWQISYCEWFIYLVLTISVFLSLYSLLYPSHELYSNSIISAANTVHNSFENMRNYSAGASLEILILCFSYLHSFAKCSGSQ